MKTVEEHTTPDDLLTLEVCELEGGDIGIGFRGCSWHTHADILASIQNEPEPAAIRQFVNQIIQGRRVIAVLRRAGQIIDAWVSEDPDGETSSHARFAADDEVIELRYWSGKAYES